MRGGLKRRLGLCCAIVLVAIPACSQIVGFDGPPPAPSDAGPPKPKPKPKPMPLVPFIPQPEYAATCESCASQNCNAEHQACVDDPQCRELLRCYGACSDPLCIARCGSYDLLDYSWGGPHGVYAGRRGAESALLSAYQRCVSVYGGCLTTGCCLTACGWGLDWGCLQSSRYRWPIGRSGPYLEKSPLHLKLELMFPNDIGVPARVSTYLPSGPAGFLPREPNGWGQVELEFSGVLDGFLQIESDTGALDEFHILDYSGPFFRDTRLSRDVFPIDVHPPYPHAGFAGVIIGVTDCVGAPASGITFELEGASGPSGQSYSYYSVKDMFDFGGKTDETGAGGFADVSPANGTVTVLAKRGEQTVARRTVSLRENWLTSVVLRPLTLLIPTSTTAGKRV
jgi:hypothetical protein